MPKETQSVPLQPLSPWNAGSLLAPHFGAASYLLRPKPSRNLDEERVMRSNAEFWREVMDQRLAAGTSLGLDRFFLMDWFPRSPGLFHTSLARSAREEAMAHRHHAFTGSAKRDHAGAVDASRRNHPASARDGDDYTLVFTPKGKLSMLQGGIGCIRLKPIEISKEPHWLMTATSDGVAHAGVPVALPRGLYRSFLAAAQDRGGLTAILHGELDFLPDPFSRLFDRSVMVPRLYLRITAMERCEPSPVRPEASVAVSFASDYQGPPNLYASYVTFRPDVKGEFEDAVSWMKKEYVEGEYRGSIVTDFDQTRTIFPEAQLALSKVMDRLVNRDDLRETIKLMHASANFDAYFSAIDKKDLVPGKSGRPRNKIFISYAHAPEKDTGWVARIRTHLETLGHGADLEVWDDSRIAAGQKWRKEIEKAISETRVAIIILTPDFLASKFVREAELPPLLAAADSDGATILCVYGVDVHLSGAAERLRDYQFVNESDRTLQSLSRTARETVYKKLTRVVESTLRAP